MHLEQLLEQLLGGCQVQKVREFGTDVGDEQSLFKATGYGKPLLVEVRDGRGAMHKLVFHTAKADRFGHDRRADRASEMLLSFDTFPLIARHAQALDVGAISRDGERLTSLGDAGEFYLLTRYVEGHLYAEELREIAERGKLVERDLTHTESLVRYLIGLHRAPIDPAPDGRTYERAIRDVVGSGEGIFGIIDGYPALSAAFAARLRAIEARCVEWRWKVKSEVQRLARIHGDFHPFNIVFDDSSELTLLDASRGCLGDPADDLACLTINYLFFSLDLETSHKAAFAELWRRFWTEYLDATQDQAICQVIAPYFAWRGLVLANPAWYANLSEVARARLLDFVERVVNAECFHPNMADEIFS